MVSKQPSRSEKKKLFFKEKVCEEAQRDIQSSPGRKGQEMKSLKVEVLFVSVCQIREGINKAVTALWCLKIR